MESIGGHPVLSARKEIIAYAGPDDEAYRYTVSTVDLEPLRVLCQRLAEDFGWHPGQALVFVICGVAPVSGPRVRTTRRLSGGTESISVTLENLDPKDDPRAAAESLVKLRHSLGIHGKRHSDGDRERLAELRNYAAASGSGVEGWRDWRTHLKNRGLPLSWMYTDRRAYWRACQRAVRI